MEAKDTVMDDARIETIWRDEAMACFGSILRAKYLVKEQAGISFRAGIGEVVGWVNYYAHNQTFNGFMHIPNENWQAKLKEWGIGRLIDNE